MEFRFKYNICLLTFDSLHGHGPEYISEMLIPRMIHYELKSQDDIKLVVPRTKKNTLEDRAFGVAAPKLWNSLSKDMRNCNDVRVFKKIKDSLFWCSLQLSYGCTFYYFYNG